VAAGAGEGLPEPVALQRLVQEAGGGDPSPRATLISAGNSVLLARDLDQQWRPQPGDNAIGLGMARGPQGLRLAVLSAERKVAMESLPSQVRDGSEIQIGGSLSPGLRSHRSTSKVRMVSSLASSPRWSGLASARASNRGRRTVCDRDPGGGRARPEVLFLRSVAVGPKAPWEVSSSGGEGRDDAAAVLEQINRERQKYGAPALASDARLAAVAQAYARSSESSGSSGTFRRDRGI